MDKTAWWFIFKGHRLLTYNDHGTMSVPFLRDVGGLQLNSLRIQSLGRINDAQCFAAELPETVEAPQDMAFYGLRGLFGALDENLYGMAIRALGLINWDRTSQFCSQCGAKIESRAGIPGKECTGCGFISFPRISPAVIVLVEKGNKLLLARASRFKEDIYSVIAGFVEPGETLEDVVRREVKEETGIDVREIRYFGSQPWPFPDSLMIGFTARYAGGEIRIDGDEIVEAQWFDVNNLPSIPGKISIARSLIDWFIEKHSKKDDAGI
jgi:NAD+ diphosphatase